MHKNDTRQRPLVRRTLALLLALALLFSALPLTGLAVTREEINGLKNQAAGLEQKKADLQKQINAVASSKNSALQQKQLLEQKINVLREQIAVSEQAIASLPEDMRAAVVLRDLQGLSYEEIAEALSTNVGTIKSRISRGREKLRQILVKQPELFGLGTV